MSWPHRSTNPSSSEMSAPAAADPGTRDANHTRDASGLEDAPSVDIHGQTHRGIVRKDNQDAFLVAALTQGAQVEATSLQPVQPSVAPDARLGYLVVVADGMGGHRGGSEASAIAIRTLLDRTVATLPRLQREADADDPVVSSLRDAVQASSDAVNGYASTRPELEGMGTTLTAAYLLWPHLIVAHVGDSRCYLWRDGHLRRLTRDHTMQQRLLDEGSDLKVALAYSHVLCSVVGASWHEVEVDVHQELLHPGDRLLLCSDGLTGHVDDATIAAHVGAGLPTEICEQLIAAALDGGGKDNVTVVCAALSTRAATAAHWRDEVTAKRLRQAVTQPRVPKSSVQAIDCWRNGWS